nr:conjugal transfer protein TrbL family protein [Zhaonella formicivorans]
MSWVQAIMLFFSYLAWALYGTVLVVSAFECGTVLKKLCESRAFPLKGPKKRTSKESSPCTLSRM